MERYAVEAARLAAANEEANSLSRQSLAASQRAWLRAEAKIIGPLKCTYAEEEGAGCSIGLSIIVENLGKSPATQVYVVPHIILQRYEFGHSTNMELDEISKNQVGLSYSAEDIYSDSAGQRHVMFPGEKLEFPAVMMAVDRNKNGRDNKSRAIKVIFMGCVDYSFLFDAEHHQTWLAYEVRVRDHIHRLINWDDGEIPAESLILIDAFGARKYGD
jgi:hypothetical protein